MKKWANLSVAVALAAIVGCGGSSHHHGNPTTGTDGGGITTSARVNIATPNGQGVTYGRAEFDFLTGQGISSRDPGDLSAVVRQLTLEDQFGIVTTTSPTPTAIPLRTYTSQIVALDVPFTTQNSRLFESFTLQFLKFLREEAGGAPTELAAPDAKDFPARIRVFPGRNTNIPILLSDAMFSDNGSGGVDFNVDEFTLRNADPSNGGYIHSFISDYVAFDMSNMPIADRPVLSNGQVATRFYESGDDQAISAGGQSGTFEVMTTDPSQPIVGSYGPQNVIQHTPGTYNLEQVNPSDLSGLSRITSIHGIWRDLDTVITGVSDFEMITYPNINDDNQQDVVIVRRNGGVITALYYGFLDYNVRKFDVFPVKDLVTASVQGELTGTIDTLMTASGAATTSPDSTRFGHFTFDSGQTLPDGFQNTGTFIVFRK